MRCKFYLSLIILIWVTSGHAQKCGIDRLTTNQLQLNATTQTKSALSFKVNCDTKYTIIFRTRNGVGNSGKSYLTSGRNGRLQTQMHILGANGSQWNTPLTQSTNTSQFMVMVQLIDRPTEFTPAGEYTDNLYISLMF